MQHEQMQPITCKSADQVGLAQEALSMKTGLKTITACELYMYLGTDQIQLMMSKLC